MPTIDVTGAIATLVMYPDPADPKAALTEVRVRPNVDPRALAEVLRDTADRFDRIHQAATS